MPPTEIEIAEYREDVSKITKSGLFDIGDEERMLNQRVYMQCLDIMPVDDIHKINDADLIMRFLIANKFKVEPTVKNLRDYVDFRKKYSCNEILWKPWPEEFYSLPYHFQGFDKEGHPIMYDFPDPGPTDIVLSRYPREMVLECHIAMMEHGRRLYKTYRSDRVVCVFDLTLVGIAFATNPRALSFMKYTTHTDQYYYPEHMLTAYVCNAGWAFNGVYKMLKPLMAERVQKKFQFISKNEDLFKFIDRSVLSLKAGGTASPEYLHHSSDFSDVAIGTPPQLRNLDGTLCQDPQQLRQQVQQQQLTRTPPGGTALEHLKHHKHHKHHHGQHQHHSHSHKQHRRHRSTSSGVANDSLVSPSTLDAGGVGDELEVMSFKSLEDDFDDDDLTTTTARERSETYLTERTPSASVVAPSQSPPPRYSASSTVVPPTATGNGTTTGGARLTMRCSSFNRQPQSLQQYPTRSASKAKTLESLDITIRTVGVNGPRQIEGSVDGVLLATCTGHSILSGVTRALQAEVIAEAGHLVHTHLIVVDAEKIPHYICKRRKLHSEIEIFRPVTGATLVLKKNMRMVVEGERVHTFSCKRRPEGHDWMVSVHQDKEQAVQAVKVGDTVRFQRSFLPEYGCNPFVLFALAVAIDYCWQF